MKKDVKVRPDLPRALHRAPVGEVSEFCYWCQSILRHACATKKEAKVCPNGSYEKNLGIELPKDRI